TDGCASVMGPPRSAGSVPTHRDGADPGPGLHGEPPRIIGRTKMVRFLHRMSQSGAGSGLAARAPAESCAGDGRAHGRARYTRALFEPWLFSARARAVLPRRTSDAWPRNPSRRAPFRS